jgi:hypothetical protein
MLDDCKQHGRVRAGSRWLWRAAVSVALVALAACRPAAQAPAVVSAGQPVAAGLSEDGEDADGEDMDDMFLEEDCLRVLAPEHAPAPEPDDGADDRDDIGAEPASKPAAEVRGVSIVQPDEAKPLFVCLVDIFREDDGEGVYTLGVIARRPRWTAIQTDTYSYERYDTNEEDEDWEPGDRIWREESWAEIGLAAISPEENAVVFTLSSDERGIEETASEKDESLYRVTESGLTLLLSVGSRAAGNEVGSAEESRSFEIVTESLTQGYYDIRVDEHRRGASYGEDEEHSSESEEYWYRWNGADYVISEP